jgi:hypothetical protein
MHDKGRPHDEMFGALEGAKVQRPSQPVRSVRHLDSYYFLLSDYDVTKNGRFGDNVYPPRPLQR